MTADRLDPAAHVNRISRAGHGISRAAGLRLLRDEELLSLGQRAAAVCRQLHGDQARTFAVDRNINYTNLCLSRCGFCAFYHPAADGDSRDDGDSGAVEDQAAPRPDSYVLDDAALFAKIAAAVEAGATHILLQGGLHPQLGLEHAEQLLLKIRRRFSVRLHFFSPPEVVHFARLAGLDLATTLGRLRDAGLGSLPGGGAEILSDRVRELVSPRKCSAAEWLAVMRTAHGLGLRSTATMMFGHAESLEERIEHLDLLRQLQDETGGFTAFICWPFQADNTLLGRQLRAGRLAAPWTGDGHWRRTGGTGYLRTLATARVYLDNFQHVQASWVTMGPKIGQLALAFGADDLGSTMMEENVVRAAGVSHRQSRRELVRLISRAGFEPRQRDCLYDRTWPVDLAD